MQSDYPHSCLTGEDSVVELVFVPRQVEVCEVQRVRLHVDLWATWPTVDRVPGQALQ